MRWQLLFAADELTRNSELRALCVSDTQTRQSGRRAVGTDPIGSADPTVCRYEWPPLLEFVRAALELPSLHLSADRMGRFYFNVFNKNDQLGWSQRSSPPLNKHQ